VTDAYTYDVFGALRASTGSSANPWLFTGEQNDADSGLYYLPRHYDPATGRFLSESLSSAPCGLRGR
jgi:RHS repeat-associated protein